MTFERQVCRILDDEHRSSLDLLGRVEHTLTRGSGWDDLAQPLRQLIGGEITRHFGFEEDELFPRLRDAGDGGIAALLEQEHCDIRELCGELQPLADALRAGTLDAGQRGTFRQLAFELVERMVSHIQKETMGMLPMLDDLLDDDADRELALAYADAR